MKKMKLTMILLLVTAFLAACSTNESEKEITPSVAETNVEESNKVVLEKESEYQVEDVPGDRPKNSSFMIMNGALLEGTSGDLYESNTQDISFYVFKGYDIEQSKGVMDTIYSIDNKNSYMNIKVITEEEMEIMIQQLKDAEIENHFSEFKGAKLYSLVENENERNVTKLLIPSNEKKPALDIEIRSSVKLESIFIEMAKTIENK